MTPSILDNNFLSLLQDLPLDTQSRAVASRAFLRPRVFRSALELLRAVLLYSVCDLSLRQIAALFTVSRRQITDEGVRSRLNSCADWIAQLVGNSLAHALPLPNSTSRRLVICDGSLVSAPGARGDRYRLHLSFDPLTQRCSQLQMTDWHSGESLSRFAFAVGDLVLADRNFAKAPQLLALVNTGAHFVVRCSPQYLKLLTAAGQPFDLIAALRAQGEMTDRSFAVQVCDAKTQRRCPAFVYARRLNEEQIKRARRRVKGKASKEGRTLKADSLWLCEWVLVLTNVPEDELRAEAILELYRVRWQIELLIKRLKSLLNVKGLRARSDGPLAAVWLWGKLLYAVMIEQQAMKRCGAEWGQMKPGRRASWWRIWQLLRDEMKEMILNTSAWRELDWQEMLIALSERGRKRKLQCLSPQVRKWLGVAPLTQPI